MKMLHKFIQGGLAACLLAGASASASHPLPTRTSISSGMRTSARDASPLQRDAARGYIGRPSLRVARHALQFPGRLDPDDLTPWRMYALAAPRARHRPAVLRRDGNVITPTPTRSNPRVSPIWRL